MRVISEIFSSLESRSLELAREMGIAFLGVTFAPEDTNQQGVQRVQAAARKQGLTIVEAGSPQLQKCPSIIWGREDRDKWIHAYNEFTRVLGNAGIPVNYLAWQPHGTLRSGVGPGEHSHGMPTFRCSLEELEAKGNLNPDQVTDAALWDNFRYFLEKALPVCEREQVRLALHPNDPPLACVCGIPSLIWNTQCYRKAFALAGDSPYLGMKLCIGCWLENPDFGDLFQDIETFCRKDKILTVHFRNVSSPLPQFEETLAEDGYGDMIAIMAHLVRCGCCANISIDHAFFHPETGRMSETSCAYMTGYLKGLLHSAQAEAGRSKEVCS